MKDLCVKAVRKSQGKGEGYSLVSTNPLYIQQETLKGINKRFDTDFKFDETFEVYIESWPGANKKRIIKGHCPRRGDFHFTEKEWINSGGEELHLSEDKTTYYIRSARKII